MAGSKQGRVLAPADNVAPGLQAPARIAIGWKRTSWKSLLGLEAPLLTLFLSVLTFSVLVTPENLTRYTAVDVGYSSLVTCPLLALTGVPCLFCGMTRSFTAMGSLDVGQAVTFHPLGPALFIITILVAAGLVFSLASRRRLVVDLSPSVWITAALSTAAVVALAWPVKLYLWQEAGLMI